MRFGGEVLLAPFSVRNHFDTTLTPPSPSAPPRTAVLQGATRKRARKSAYLCGFRADSTKVQHHATVKDGLKIRVLRRSVGSSPTAPTENNDFAGEE
jgi:hypothetical protein